MGTRINNPQLDDVIKEILQREGTQDVETALADELDQGSVIQTLDVGRFTLDPDGNVVLRGSTTGGGGTQPGTGTTYSLVQELRFITTASFFPTPRLLATDPGVLELGAVDFTRGNITAQALAEINDPWRIKSLSVDFQENAGNTYDVYADFSMRVSSSNGDVDSGNAFYGSAQEVPFVQTLQPTTDKQVFFTSSQHPMFDTVFQPEGPEINDYTIQLSPQVLTSPPSIDYSLVVQWIVEVYD